MLIIINFYLMGYAIDYLYLKGGIILRSLGLNGKELQAVREVKVGYERYGAQADIEHFKEMMRIEGSSFPIYELNWVGGGGSQSKKDRIQRLRTRLKGWFILFSLSNR